MRIPVPSIQREPTPNIGRIGAPPLASVPSTGGVADLAAGFGHAARALAELEHEGDKARASEKIASAQLAFTQAEQDAQTKFDPATSGSHVEPVAKQFDDVIAQTLKDAQTEGERDLVRDRLRLVRTDALQRAIRFEADARQTYRLQALDSSLDKRASTALLDPTQAQDLLAQQLVDVNNSATMSPLERQARTVRAQQAIAAASLANVTDPELARASPMFKYLSLDAQEAVVKRAATAGRLVRAQGVADSIMAKRLPLDEAMRQIEKDLDGEDEKLAKAEVASRYAYAEAARRDREQEIYGTALLEVEQRGRVTPATWAKLTDGHRAAILNRQQAEARQRRLEAEGRPVKTDWTTYLDLREQAINEPTKFARLDLRQYVDRIGGAQLEQLVDLKAKASEPKKGFRDAITLTQQMNATMQALNIKKPAQKGAFLSFVQSAVDDAMQAKGKPLSFDERQKIIDDAVLQGPDPDAWLWGTKRAFELTPEQRTRFKPNPPTDAPATEVEALNEALRQQGLPPTPENRLRLYERAQGRR